MLPELQHIFAGCERAHSIVVNPHKWMFVPMDCSVLYARPPDLLKRAFALSLAILVTPEDDSARNMMDYGISLGRRFRALKLWFVMRYYGANGMAARIREHIRIAANLEKWIDANPAFEILAPVKFSVVLFRHVPPGLIGNEPALESHNARILERVNASGEVFMSHTKVRDRYALRVAIGNMRTREAHIRRAWELVRNAAESA